MISGKKHSAPFYWAPFIWLESGGRHGSLPTERNTILLLRSFVPTQMNPRARDQFASRRRRRFGNVSSRASD